MNTLAWRTPTPGDVAGARAASTALWVFIGVASTLFSLFLLAYAMRMDGAADWARLALPWQLWLSSALLLAGSAGLQRAARARAARARAVLPLRLGAVCALLFVLVQAWAWAALLGQRVGPAGNPAASFFYLLTALHALHVLGGLAAWAYALRDPAPWRIALCARYWHFLLALWAVLFAAFGLLTPEVVAFVCGRG